MNALRVSFIVLLLTGSLLGCHAGDGAAVTAARDALMNTDKAFSAASVQQGFAAAFKRYATDDALLLPENSMALRGEALIEQSLQGMPASTRLSWTPQAAAVAASGDMGYTWGIYELTGTNAAGQATLAYGKYLAVWQKPSGEWRLTVMMINQSPGPTSG